jgi:uncharacterized membrane protein
MRISEIESMSGTEAGLIASVITASAVEAVEAATIVLAIGFTRGWRSSLVGLGRGSWFSR